MNRWEELYHEAKADKWLQGFALFCRIVLAASFLPTGLVKIMGERFAEGLPSNNPLGHYFDALYLTGYYYTFIGVAQVTIAILILIPRTSYLGVLLYFPMIVNICVLTYATRFAGTRANTMLLLGCLYLLIWNYDRLKYLLPHRQSEQNPLVVKKPVNVRLRFIFFGTCVALLAVVIIGTSYLWEIGPGNSEAECRNQCEKNPGACEFCDCIYKEGKPLDSCLATFNKAGEMRKADAK